MSVGDRGRKREERKMGTRRKEAGKVGRESGEKREEYGSDWTVPCRVMDDGETKTELDNKDFNNSPSFAPPQQHGTHPTTFSGLSRPGS